MFLNSWVNLIAVDIVAIGADDSIPPRRVDEVSVMLIMVWGIVDAAEPDERLKHLSK